MAIDATELLAGAAVALPNAEAVLADIVTVLQIGKLAVDLEQDAAPFIIAAWNIAINKRAMTDAERADMLAKEQALRARAFAPEA